jgi:hypothetical protein
MISQTRKRLEQESADDLALRMDIERDAKDQTWDVDVQNTESEVNSEL